MNFEAAIQHLCDACVVFVVIGGWAAIFHGSAHVTSDRDICYSRDKENLRKVARLWRLIVRVASRGIHDAGTMIPKWISKFESRKRL